MKCILWYGYLKFCKFLLLLTIYSWVLNTLSFHNTWLYFCLSLRLNKKHRVWVSQRFRYHTFRSLADKSLLMSVWQFPLSIFFLVNILLWWTVLALQCDIGAVSDTLFLIYLTGTSAHLRILWQCMDLHLTGCYI